MYRYTRYAGNECGLLRRYKDIGALMKRCETLVVTRDKARESLRRCKEEITRQEAGLVVFKEEQNERILELRHG